jgi:plastocyanin
VGQTVDVSLKNIGSATHNMRTAGDDNKYNTGDDAVSDPQFISGGQQGKLSFKFGKAGTYNYQCDFHPADMKGQIVVTE